MPMSRYEVRNEYSLADPEVYRAADKDDPEALLEGVAMAGLVGVLRQLGDLAEFAAEIFHDLHEEVMVTAARGHTLMVRVQQLETEFPPIEKAFLSQTSHSTFFFNSGTEWHPNLQMNRNLITKGDLPRFVMDSYEEARGPPRLFLLDKFDSSGAGSCLKRYTDPSFYKVEASFVDMESVDVQRDKKFRKAKKGPRWKHEESPKILPSSKLHQLFLEEQVESGASDPARLVKLKRKSSASAFCSENGKSYMDKFLKTPPEDKVVHEVSVGSSPLKLPSKSPTGSGLESQIFDVSNVGPDVEPVQRIRGPFPPPSLGRTIVGPSENDLFEGIGEEKNSAGSSSNPSFDDKEINVDERESYHSDCDDASEIDNYMDALATMESEVETDAEFISKKEDVEFLNNEKHGTFSDSNGEQLQSQSQISDSQSIGNSTASDDGNNSVRKGLSSFSHSDDTVSTSAEDTPSSEIGETEVACIPFSQDSTNGKVRVDQLLEHEPSEYACSELAEIHGDKAPLSSTIDPEAIFVEDDKSGELESDDASSDASEILSDPVKTEEQPVNDKSDISSGPTETEERVADENGEISCGFSKIEKQSKDDDGENSGGPTKREEQLENEDYMLQRSDEISPTLSYEEHLEDESALEDSCVDSSIIIDTANIVEEIHEKKDSENSLEDVVQTKFVEDFSARSSVDTQVLSPDSDISHPEEQPSVLHLEGLAENTNGDISDKFDSAEIGLVYSDERDLDGTQNGKLSRDSESNVEEGGNEPRVNLVAMDFLTGLSGHQNPSSLADDLSQSDEREDKMVHPEDEVDSARNSSHEREGGYEKILESESPHACNHVEETDVSLSNDCIPVLASLEERVDTESDKLDLQPANIPESSDLSSRLEPIDSPNHVNHKTHSNPEFDSFEELDVGPTHLNLVESKETDRESCPGLISGEASVSEFPQMSNHTFDPLTPASVFPGFNLLPEVAQLNLEEMPPLPPLPPMQWRIGKFQQNNHFQLMSTANSHHEDFTGNMVNSTPFLLQMPMPNLGENRDDYVALKETQSSNPSTSVSATHNEWSQHEEEGVVIQPTTDHSGSPVDFLALGQAQSLNPFAEHAGEGEIIQPTVDHSDSRVDFIALGQTPSIPFTGSPETCNDTPLQASTAGEEGMIQPTDDPSTPEITPGPTSTCSSETPNEDSTQSPLQLLTEASLGKEEQDHSCVVSEMTIVEPPRDFVPHPPVKNRQPESVEQTTKEEIIGSSSSSVVSEMTIVGTPEDIVTHTPVENRLSAHVESTTKEENICSSSTSAVPFVDDEKPNTLTSVDHEWPNGNQIPKLTRTRSPLIDAVFAHDKSKLRKVTERVRPHEQKVEEKDSVLEQIRTKSFNLKQAVATRPTIQGPRTNLRVAAILEKANAIRQAFAGSDDDEDSWSDS